MKEIFDRPLTEEKRIRYRGRNRSGVGRMSLILGILVWVIFAVLVWDTRGADVDYNRIAVLGILDFLLAIGGMVLAGRGWKESNVYYWSALVGTLLNTGMVVTLFCLYLIGAVV